MLLVNQINSTFFFFFRATNNWINKLYRLTSALLKLSGWTACRSLVRWSYLSFLLLEFCISILHFTTACLTLVLNKILINCPKATIPWCKDFFLFSWLNCSCTISSISELLVVWSIRRVSRNPTTWQEARNFIVCKMVRRKVPSNG